LNPEIAWNFGASFTQSFLFFGKNADVTLDVYRTDFQNQVVVDVMQSPQQVLFYNLTGKSFANSLQLEFNYDFSTRFKMRSAYKMYDVRTDYLSGTFQRPLQAQNRFFANLEYETLPFLNSKQWRFDFTYNWIGKQQLPTTKTNPRNDQFPEFSAAYSLMNTQITRVFSSVFEIYIGGENIGNYTQSRAIIGNENPFGTSFDSYIVYAPIFGQMYYAGLRFTIK
jgi:hypothetical protein